MRSGGLRLISLQKSNKSKDTTTSGDWMNGQGHRRVKNTRRPESLLNDHAGKLYEVEAKRKKHEFNLVHTSEMYLTSEYGRFNIKQAQGRITDDKQDCVESVQVGVLAWLNKPEVTSVLYFSVTLAL